MDIGVVVPGNSLEQHGGGVSILAPAGVVGTGVAARGIIGSGQTAVGADQGPGVIVGSAVDIVRLESDDFGGSRLEAVKKWMINVRTSTKPESREDVLCSHVKFHECFDIRFSFGVASSDGLRAKETGFLAGIEVDLDRGGGLEIRGDQGPENLNSVDGAGTVLTG